MMYHPKMLPRRQLLVLTTLAVIPTAGKAHAAKDAYRLRELRTADGDKTSLAVGPPPDPAPVRVIVKLADSVSRERLLIDADEQSGLPEVVRANVALNEDGAWIPDLTRIEDMIGEAVKAAA